MQWEKKTTRAVQDTFKVKAPVKPRLPQAALTLQSISTLILRSLIPEFLEA